MREITKEDIEHAKTYIKRWKGQVKLSYAMIADDLGVCAEKLTELVRKDRAEKKGIDMRVGYDTCRCGGSKHVKDDDCKDCFSVYVAGRPLLLEDIRMLSYEY